MGAFADFLNEKKIETTDIVRASQRVEKRGTDDRTLSIARANKRAKDKDKSYAEAELAKPRSGRGVSPMQVQTALNDKPVPPRVRAKLVRAVNAILTSKKQEPVAHPALFGDVTARTKAEKKE